MSGECDQCGEHAVECECKSSDMHDLASMLIVKNIQDIQFQVVLSAISEAGLLKEFKLFWIEKGPHSTMFGAMIRFAKLYPDKFHIPNEEKSYGKFVIINEREH